MASHQDDAVLPGEDLSSSSQDEDEDDVVDDDEDDDEELENDDDAVHCASPSTSSAIAVVVTPSAAANAVTVALPAAPKGEAPAIHATTVIADLSGSDRRISDAVVAAQAPDEKKPALDDSRKLFQRLWTDEDEIELLQGFLDYTAQRGKSTHHGQNDTALFYDQIKSKLQLDFNKNQLVEKLRRLKKKYRNIVNKISSGKELSFKSPHDQATYEISRKIWSNIGPIGADDNAMEDDDPNPNSNANFSIIEVKGEDAGGGGFSFDKKTPPRSRKRSRSKPDPRTDDRRCFSSDGPATIKDNCNNGGGNNHSNGNVQGLIEDTVKSCLSPLFKELLGNAMGGPFAAATRGFGSLAMNPMPLSFGVPPLNLGIVEVGDERWRKQQILELEVYSKRLELVQDQIKEALDELRSKGGS